MERIYADHANGPLIGLTALTHRQQDNRVFVAPHTTMLCNGMSMSPSTLSMMMTQLVLNVFGSNAHSLCQQLERATDVQRILRDKRVEEYQQQIQKEIEQFDRAR